LARVRDLLNLTKLTSIFSRSVLTPPVTKGASRMGHPDLWVGHPPREFDFSRIGFASEDLSKALAPIAFTFERRLQQPFSANRYYSEAPLQTDEHIELLDMLEGILKT